MKGRMTKLQALFGVGLASVFMTGPMSQAVAVPTVPFTEDFDVDEAGWHDVSLDPLGWEADGGPDGTGDGYATTTFNFVSSSTDDSPALFRAQDKWNSSGGAFEGNYIQEGANAFKVYVRHNASVPLSYFARFSGPFNFPGAIAIAFAPVPSGVWTELDIPIHFGSANLISFEGSDYKTVFTNIGHVQVGIIVPAALAGVDQEFTFDIDKVTIDNNPVPAVSEWGLAVMALLTVTAGTVAIRRRKELVVG